MPSLTVDEDALSTFGSAWIANGGRLGRSPPNSSIELGNFFDKCVATALATMLGGVPIEPASSVSLLPPGRDCVELGPTRVIGGVRPQNFDVGYRPDGVRFVFDSKTLNDSESVGKNYQNMINDLATEATTVHSRFPYALVTFMVIIPGPCLVQPQRSALIGTLERLTGRSAVNAPAHLAEAIALVVWEPASGKIDLNVPESVNASLRIENFSEQVQSIYWARYKGLPPHTG